MHVSFQDDIKVCFSILLLHPHWSTLIYLPVSHGSYHSHISSFFMALQGTGSSQWSFWWLLAPYWAANIYLAASLVTSITFYQIYVAVSLVNGQSLAMSLTSCSLIGQWSMVMPLNCPFYWSVQVYLGTSLVMSMTSCFLIGKWRCQ